MDFYDTDGRKVARVTEDRALGRGRQPWLDTLADGLLEERPPSGWTGPARRREQELEAEVRELRRQLHEARQAEQHWRAVACLEDCTGRDLLTYQTLVDGSAERCPEVSGAAEMPLGGSRCAEVNRA